MQNFEKIAGIIGVIILCIAVFIITKNIYSIPAPQKTNTVVETIQLPPITLPAIITKGKTRVDTIKSTDTLWFPILQDQLMVSADTTIIKGNDTVTVGVKYYFPPKNSFEFYADPYLQSKTITNVIEVEKGLTFWKRFRLGAGVGLSLNSDMKAFPSLNVGLVYIIL